MNGHFLNSSGASHAAATKGLAIILGWLELLTSNGPACASHLQDAALSCGTLDFTALYVCGS